MRDRGLLPAGVVSRVGALLLVACVGGSAVGATRPTTTASKATEKRSPPRSKPEAGRARPPASASKPSPTMAEVQLVPLREGVGEAVPEFTLGLMGDRRKREVRSVGGKVRVPPGVYWVTNWSVGIVDAQGRKWRARGGLQGMPSARSRLELRAGQRVRIPLVAPLGMAVSPRVLGRTVKLTLSFFGSLGDRCYDVSVDAKKPPRPSVSIVDATGKVIDRLDFSYG